MLNKTQSSGNEHFIVREQTQLLYSGLPSINFLYLLIGSFIFWLISREIGYWRTLPWFGCLLIVLLIRHAIYLEYKNADSQNLSYHRWQLIYIIFCSSATAITWGVVGGFFFFKISPHLQTILLFTLVGLSASVMPILAVKLSSYALYLLIIIAPIFTQILLHGTDNQKLMMILAALLILTFCIISKRFSKAFRDSLVYRAEFEKLSEHLKTVNARLSLVNEDLERLSVTDDLTGIANRRYFNKRFAEVWSDHVRESQTLSALMIDVDFFKNYNDNYGHLEGDKCLRVITESIHSLIFRPRDLLARYGGEEFIILLPNTNKTGAEQVANRIHQRIKDLKLENKPGGIGGLLTVSIGITEEQPSRTCTKNDFLNRVDNALYQAKKSGRNTTCFLSKD